MNSSQTSLSYNDVPSLVSQTSLTSSVTTSALSRQSSTTETFYYGVPSQNHRNLDLLEDDDEVFVNPTEEVFMTMNIHKTYWETLSEFSR